MRLSESLRNEVNNKLLVDDKFSATRSMLIQAADLLDVYYTQCKATSVGKTRGECRRNVKVALGEDT